MQDPVTKLWSKEGTIEAVRPSGRSYIVDSGDRLYKRNLKWSKPLPAEQVTVVHDDVSGAELDEVSAAGGDDSAEGDSCPPAPAPAQRRRSCLAAKAEKLRWRHGEEVTLKSVTWARPLTTSSDNFVLQTRDGRVGLHGSSL